jgi:GTPase Era involved in 16S rRNA processing
VFEKYAGEVENLTGGIVMEQNNHLDSFDTGKEEYGIFSSRKDEVEPEELPKYSISKTAKGIEQTGVERGINYGVRLSKHIESMHHEACALLKELKMDNLVSELDRIENEMQYEKFRIAVVGEFNRGKSTFVNRLLGQTVVPTGVLPTTAMITKISYAPENRIVHIDEHGKRNAFLFDLQVWENLTLTSDGGSAGGQAYVLLNDPWLYETGVELIDTPGAGDLSQECQKPLGYELQRDDAAIIVVRADSALSLSEHFFIEQHIMAHKIPRVMLVVTHMDMLMQDQCEKVLSYIKAKLQLWKLDIPICALPGSDMPLMAQGFLRSIDEVKNLLKQWMSDEERGQLKNEQAIARISTVLQFALQSVLQQSEQCGVSKAEVEQRAAAMRQKLSQIHLTWESLRVDMLGKASDAFQKIGKLTQERISAVVERLQYEVRCSKDVVTWFKNDYPYLVKVEMSSLAKSVDALASNLFQEDVRWFNSMLTSRYKSSIDVDKPQLVDEELFESMQADDTNEFANLSDQRKKIRIGAAVASMAAYAFIMVIGAPIPPLLATTGIGTGVTIISEKFFDKKAKEQQEMMSEKIAKDLPHVMNEAMADAEKRLVHAYDVCIEEARKQEELWTQVQEKAIDDANRCTNQDDVMKLTEYADKLTTMIASLKMNNSNYVKE